MKKLLLLFWLLPAITLAQLNDLSLDSAFHRMGVGGFYENGLEYYQIPTNLFEPIQFSAHVSNVGANDLTNCKLKVEVEAGGETIFLDSSAAVNLASGESDSLYLDSQLMSYALLGEHNLKFQVISDSLDDNDLNNTIVHSIEITDDNEGGWSRSNNILSETISHSLFTFGDKFLIGYVVESFDEGGICVNGAEVFIYDTISSIGQDIICCVFVWNAVESIWELKDQVDTEIYESDLGTYKECGFLDVDVSDLEGPILVAIGHYGGPNPPVLGLSQKAEYGTVYKFKPLGGFNWQYELVEDPKIPMFSILTYNGHSCWGSIEENGTTSFNLSQNHPNPFNSNTTISYVLNQTNNVDLTVTDLHGKHILQENLGLQTTGEHSYQLFTENWAEGVYLYTLKVGDDQLTKRMVLLR